MYNNYTQWTAKGLKWLQLNWLVARHNVPFNHFDIFCCLFIVLSRWFCSPNECIIKPLGSIDVLNSGKTMYQAKLTYTFHVVGGAMGGAIDHWLLE